MNPFSFILLMSLTFVVASSAWINCDNNNKKSSCFPKFWERETSKYVEPEEETEDTAIKNRYCEFYKKVQKGYEIRHNGTYIWMSSKFLKALYKGNLQEAGKYISFDDLLDISFKEYFSRNKKYFWGYYCRPRDSMSYLFYSIKSELQYAVKSQNRVEQKQRVLLFGSVSMEFKQQFGYRLYMFVSLTIDDTNSCSIVYFVEHEENKIIDDTEIEDAMNLGIPVLYKVCGEVKYDMAEKFVKKSDRQNLAILLEFEHMLLEYLPEYGTEIELFEEDRVENFKMRIALSDTYAKQPPTMLSKLKFKCSCPILVKPLFFLFYFIGLFVSSFSPLFVPHIVAISLVASFYGPLAVILLIVLIMGISILCKCI